MKPNVYIETSVISYYTAKPSRDLVTAGRQQLTRDWWEETRKHYKIFVSVLVLEESKSGDKVASEKRLKTLKGLPVLQINDKAETLTEILIKEGAIPVDSTEDALHIAIATVNGMDFLLTWNFNHINNAQKKLEIAKILEKYEYICPAICSPEELLGE
jgi:hypothetical protein